MADNHLQFRIGSVFSGEGFKAARASVKDLNGGMNAAMGAAEKMSASLGGLDTSASKAMGALTGMLGSLLTLNATAIITQGAMMAITLYTTKLKEEAEELTKRSDALKASMAKTFSAALTKDVAATTQEVARISSEFERVTKQAAAFTAAVNGLKGSIATGGIVNLEIEKVNALLEAHSDAERQAIEATYSLKIAHEKAAATEEAWNAKIDAAHQAYVDNETRVAKIDEQLSVIAAKRNELESMITATRGEFGEVSKQGLEMQKKVNELNVKEAELRQAQNDALDRQKILAIDEEKVRQDALNAMGQATAAVKQAELADQKLTEAKSEREYKEREARDAAELKAAADRADKERAEELAAVRQEAADIQKEVNAGAADLKSAQAAYAEALRKYEANFAENKMWEAFHGAEVKPLQGLNLGAGGLDATMVENAVKNAIANGEVRTVADLNKFQRMAQREARNKITQARSQFGREKQRYEALQERNRKTWSKQDADFVAKFEKLKEAAEAQKKDLDDKKARLAAAQKRDEDNHKNLEKIAKQMEALGLK